MTSPNPTPDIERIAEGLTDAQRDRLQTLDPHDVSRFHYHHFKGCSQGLFAVAPGWQRMELSPLGEQVRHYLKETADNG